MVSIPIPNEFVLSDMLVNFYNTAKEYHGSRIVLLNTYNPQSSLCNFRYAVNVLKADKEGNESIAYIHGELLEVNNSDIINRGIDYFKNHCNKYNHDIPIEVWTDYSNPAVYW